MHGVHKMEFPRRRSVPRLVNAIANKSGGCERLPVAIERLFRGSVSMGEQRDRMGSLTCRKELKRRCLFGERHFLDANGRLNPMRERNAGDEANGGDSDNHPVPTCVHSEQSLRTVLKSCDRLSCELCRVAKSRKGVIP